MVRLVMLCLSIVLSVPSFANSVREHEHLLKECRRLIENLYVLENQQHKALCKSKLSSAAFKMELSAAKLEYKRYKETIHHLSFALEDVMFSIYIDCNMKHDIRQVKKDAEWLRHQVEWLHKKG